ncbi:hypothetical protein PAPHI01_0223 [Pancytospora philotis]|nr:hypothetical protein PAPHI01_0223 [Pancytospora philotis]
MRLLVFAQLIAGALVGEERPAVEAFAAIAVYANKSESRAEMVLCHRLLVAHSHLETAVMAYSCAPLPETLVCAWRFGSAIMKKINTARAEAAGNAAENSLIWLKDNIAAWDDLFGSYACIFKRGRSGLKRLCETLSVINADLKTYPDVQSIGCVAQCADGAGADGVASAGTADYAYHYAGCVCFLCEAEIGLKELREQMRIHQAKLVESMFARSVSKTELGLLIADFLRDIQAHFSTLQHAFTIERLYRGPSELFAALSALHDSIQVKSEETKEAGLGSLSVSADRLLRGSEKQCKAYAASFNEFQKLLTVIKPCSAQHAKLLSGLEKKLNNRENN